MGRKSVRKSRKKLTKKANKWLAELFVKLQHESLAGVTIDDLARLANISKSTIYEYFKSKEDIVLAACRTRINTLHQSIFVAVNKSDDVLAQYEQVVAVFAQGISDVTVSFLEGIQKHYPNAWEAIDEFTDQFIDLVQEMYAEGIRKGIFADVSLELLAHLDKYFVSQIVTNPLLFSDKDISLSELVDDYLTLRLTGILKNNKS